MKKFVRHDKPHTARQEEFTKYSREMSEAAIREYGHLIQQADVRTQWRQLMRYDDKINTFLIDFTRTYIANLKSPNAKNLEFLERLIVLMADFLSKYTVRGINGNRNKAREILFAKLFTESEYIKGLQKKQAQKRQDKKTMSSKQIRAKNQRAERAAQAAYDRYIAHQVQQDIASQAMYKKRK